MADKATFYMGQDWTALLEMGPAAREVLNLLMVNSAPGRNGRITHTVHVTASWFGEMTAHWETPITPSKARRGMNELVKKGVLARLNAPQDGLGFVVRFISEPSPDYEGPTSGWGHAQSVSDRCGTKSIYLRGNEKGKEEKVVVPPKAPARHLGDQYDEGDPQGQMSPEPYTGTPPQEPPADDGLPEFDLSGLDGYEARSGDRPTREMAEFAAELEEITGQQSEERLHLMAGVCRRIAEAVRPALERGWEPKALARRLNGELNPKIHSPERLLLGKIKDIGNPPVGRRNDGKVVMNGRAVDMGSIDLVFEGAEPLPEAEEPLPSPQVKETERERLARLARRLYSH